MMIAKVFKCGNSQAIRIPKEMNTDEKEFIIKKRGKCIYLIPKDDPWALLKQCLGQADDMELERNQPLISELPEREELL
ncbi:MAG: hypothetical protein K6C38_07680 [Saccharofermentans sp.]|nr:hypothetical protein [Saccharofermentans sp.]